MLTLEGVRSNFGDLAACIHFEVVRDKDGRLKTFCTLLSRCEGIAMALLLAKKKKFQFWQNTFTPKRGYAHMILKLTNLNEGF